MCVYTAWPHSLEKKEPPRNDFYCLSLTLRVLQSFSGVIHIKSMQLTLPRNDLSEKYGILARVRRKKREPP